MMEENISLAKKRKKLTSNSTGNRHKFNQQKPKKPKDNSSELNAREHMRDTEIINEIDSLSNTCCPNGGEWGCCLKHFIDKETDIPDYEKALKYVKENRIASKESCSHEIRDPMVISLFKSCIKSDSLRGGERIFTMDYRMPSPTGLFGRDNAVPCCRKAIWAIYGVTEHDWRKASSRLKEVESGQNLTSLHHRPFTDKTLHDYTYAEAAAVFEENLGYTGRFFLMMYYLYWFYTSMVK